MGILGTSGRDEVKWESCADNYVGYPGKSIKSKNEIEPEEIVKYVSYMLDKRINQEEIDEILKKNGIEYDAWPITKIIVENDLKLK
jgi:hypothetical protein